MGGGGFYPAPLPHGLRTGDEPTTVRDKLGVPRKEGFYPRRGITVEFRDGKVDRVYVIAPSQIPPPPVTADVLWKLPGKDTKHQDVLTFKSTVKDAYESIVSARNNVVELLTLRDLYPGDLPLGIRWGLRTLDLPLTEKQLNPVAMFL